MTRIVYSMLSCVSFVALSAACAGDGDGEVAAAAQTQAVTVTGPAITHTGNSSASVITSFHGAPLTSPGLELRGSTASGAYAAASYRVATSSNTGSQVTVTPAAGASFIYMLLGSGSHYTTQQLRLQRIPGSSDLQAATASGNVACGPLPSGTATTVTLTLHPAARTFDVLLGGAASRCTALPLTLELPVVGFAMMDASNENYGGLVDFTDLTVF